MKKQEKLISLISASIIEKKKYALTPQAFDALNKHMLYFFSNFVRDVVNYSDLMCSLKLSKKHVDTIVKSYYQQKLLGYNNLSSNSGSKIIHSSNDNMISDVNEYLLKIIEKKIEIINKKELYMCNYEILDGIDVSVLLRTSGFARTKIEKSRNEIPVCVSGILTKDQTDFIKNNLLYMKDNTSYSQDFGLYEVFEKESQYINQLMPYISHFLTGRAAINYTKYDDYILYSKIVNRLSRNRNIDMVSYFSTLLRISISGLIGVYVGIENPRNIEEMLEINADSLKNITERCKDGFPDMKQHLYNKFVDIIFDCSSTFKISAGAVYGIVALGLEYCERILPHLYNNIKIIEIVLNNPRVSQLQTYYAQTMSNAIKKLAKFVLINTRSVDKKNNARYILQECSNVIY